MRPSEQLRFWAHELAAIARNGLEFAQNEYDRDRYERTKTIAEGIASLTIDAEFTPERAYLGDAWMASAKVGCSVAAFDDAGRVALIKRADNGRWALPGGVAEVGSSPSENALRELREETGFVARLERLVGVYDNKQFGSVSPYQFYICCFRGRITGGAATPSQETPEVVLASVDDLPEDMSELQRTMLRDAAAAADRAPAFQ
ncbi:MAG TPA: NUDIX hydrolase N-terminal domain-containing protein [Candidatus Limnocylindria bacterium]|nr:NUDIX hydrolase N-terminal domain-containing protein [Candidatus Limnocylindria bacterium]